MKNPKHILMLIVAGLIIMAATTRLLPHPPNFTPIIAIALFAGTYFKKSMWAWALPLAVMVVSDLALWWLYGYAFFSPMRLVIYLSLLVMVGFGGAISRNISVTHIAGGAFAGAILFFMVTNFAVWITGTLYPITWEGLAMCYTAGIPFFRNTLISAFIYSAVMFGAVEWAKAWWQLPSHYISTSRTNGR
ncbi:MAG: DUF6580 family putative transport protein [Balneolales bacterium]